MTDSVNVGAWLGSTAPTVGQKIEADSLPVVIASDQTAVPVAVSNFPATQPVSGTVAVSNFPATQPISAVALPLPVGASTEAKQDAEIASLAARLGVLGQATMAGSAPVVVASDQSAIPISAASLPLPTGAATEVTLAAVSTKLPATLGQKPMATSLAVVIASDQSPIPISGTITVGTVDQGAPGLVTAPWPVRLSDGAAFIGVALDSTLAALSAKFGTLGQKPMAGSAPVVIASDQSAIPVTGTFFQATQPISAVSLPLPTGAATETTLAAVSGKLPATLGQKPMATSLAVVIASDQSAVPVSGTVAVSNFPATQPVSGTVTANQGTATGAAAPWSVRLSDGAAFYDGAKTGQLPAALVGGRLDENVGAWLGSTTPTVGQKTMAASLPVTLASDQPALSVSVSPSTSATVTRSSVAASVAVVTILASNASRKGATVSNDSQGGLYLALGAAASTTSFTLYLAPNAGNGGGYYEVPFGYTGIITGVWSAAIGSARVTELT